jgi:hypothetical protein
MPKAGKNPELKIDVQPAAVKQNAAACHTGRPRIGVRCRSGKERGTGGSDRAIWAGKNGKKQNGQSG